MKTVNLNDIVTVKLTEEGLKHISDYYKEFEEEFCVYVSGWELSLNGNEYTTELHDIMNIFGEKLFVGGEQMFENEIKIN